jgi:hypothetical protein
MKAPGSDAAVDLVGAESRVEELAPRQYTMLEISQAPEPHGISRTLPAHIRERTHDPNFAPRPGAGGERGTLKAGARRSLEAKAGQQALLGLAADLGDDLDVAL